MNILSQDGTRKPDELQSAKAREMTTASILLNQYVELSRLADFSDISLDHLDNCSLQLCFANPFEIDVANIFDFELSQQLDSICIAPFRNRAAWISHRHRARTFSDHLFVKRIPDFPSVGRSSLPYAMIPPNVPFTDEITGLDKPHLGNFAQAQWVTRPEIALLKNVINEALCIDQITIQDASRSFGQKVSDTVFSLERSMIVFNQIVAMFAPSHDRTMIASVNVDGKIILVNQNVAREFVNGDATVSGGLVRHDSTRNDKSVLVSFAKTRFSSRSLAKALKTVGSMLTELGEKIEATPHNAKANENRLF